MLWTTIKERMLRTPQKTFTEENTSLTYEEAVIYAESLAEKLTGSCYAVLCKSEMFAGIALLACFAARVTAVPLSYRYGQTHLKRIVDYIHPPAIISDADGGINIVDADTGEYDAPDCSPALIMCTSGTTGSPKGVMLSEANVLNNIYDISEYFDLSESSSILISRPLYHCAVLTGEFLISLFNGINIHFISEPFNPIAIVKYIYQHKINIFCGTPTIMTMIARCFPGDELDSLKVIAVSGECMTEAAAKYMEKAFSKCDVYHVYGLTEASPRVSYLPPSLFNQSPVLIGGPLKSVELLIVDDNGNPVKCGTVGELMVKSPGNMLGYYKQPELTEKALENGWLHTKDLACVDEKGLYEIKGRKDDMIIRSGMNIYPVEIENELKKEEGIFDALAYGYKDKNDATQIGIKVVCSYDSKDKVFDVCRKRLPSYEMPTKIEIVDELPKNGSGKTVRR